MKKLLVLTLLLFLSVMLILSCDIHCDCDDDGSGPTGPSGNSPPDSPSSPFPPDSTTGVGTSSVTLSWTCSDPDSDSITYELLWAIGGVYQSHDTVSGLTANAYTLNNLHHGVRYWWRITVFDEHGEENTGDSWDF